MLKRLGLLVAVLAVIVAACGGGGGGLSGEAKAKADEIKAELLADGGGDNPFTDDKTASCFADGIVGAFGVARINELDTGAGVEAGFENMTAAEQEKVADLALDCVDFKKIIKEQMAGAGLPDNVANCVGDKLNKDLLKGLFLAQIRGEDPSNSEALMAVVMQCFTG